MEPLDDNDELKRIAPTLHGLPKADPFVVPDGFFDRFPHQVQAAIVAGTRVHTPVWNCWKRMAIALPVIALIGLGAWWFRSAPIIEPAVAFSADSLPSDPTMIDDLEETDLVAFIEETDNANTDLGAVDMRLDEDELLAYLETENADLTDLITDLE